MYGLVWLAAAACAATGVSCRVVCVCVCACVCVCVGRMTVVACGRRDVVAVVDGGVVVAVCARPWRACAWSG